jgi:hypothetical protein
MRRAVIPLLCVAASALPALGAQAQDYPFDLAKKSPAAFAAWRKAVPAPYRRIAWIAQLAGTAGPMTATMIDGKPAYSGSACKPHDCGDNVVAFLIARDGSSVSGMTRATAVRPARLSWGAQSPERMRMLEALLRN